LRRTLRNRPEQRQSRAGCLLWTHQFRAGDAFNVACVVPATKSCPDAAGPDFDFGSSPILLSLSGGKRAFILAQKSGEVYAVDPDDRGKPLAGRSSATAARSRALSGVRPPITNASTPPSPTKRFLADGLDPDKDGGLYALSISITSGDVVWSAPASPCSTREHCSPAQTAAVTATPGLVFSGSLSGHIRASAAADGKVLWDFDTIGDFKTVNGVSAHGGSISVAGPVVAGGTVYIPSGCDTFGETPANVLLAFTPDGN
jgi:polyvinyl alcohol dehydrogenase (cytochrome)